MAQNGAKFGFDMNSHGFHILTVPTGMKML